MLTKNEKFSVVLSIIFFIAIFFSAEAVFSHPQLRGEGRALSRDSLLSKESGNEGKNRKLLSYREGRASLTVYLVYATARVKPYIDPKLKSKLPSLNKFYKFNSYFLLKRRHYLIPYRKKVNFIISQKYRVKFQVMKYIPSSKRIAIEAVFYRRKNNKKNLFLSYATTRFKLRNGKSVAFLGPHIRKGRSLLILTARHRYP